MGLVSFELATLFPVQANHALARYIVFFRQQHNEARRGYSTIPAYDLKLLQPGQNIELI
jgi:hypothetical protein